MFIRVPDMVSFINQQNTLNGITTPDRMHRMIVSTYQPFFAPFPAFFCKAGLCDLMVILDDVQFPLRTTWLTRNRFKNDQGVFWIRIPVRRKGRSLQKIRHVRICYDRNWQGKALSALRFAYAKAPYFPEHNVFLERLFAKKYEKLADLNLDVLHYLKGQLDIDTPLVLQSELGITETGTDLLVEICRATKANTYLSQGASKKYLDLDRFSRRKIDTFFFKSQTPIYPQLWGDFVPDLSTFDLLFNCGPKSRDILLRTPSRAPEKA